MLSLVPAGQRCVLCACLCVCDRGQFRQGVVSCLVLFEESGNARGELTDSSPLLSHHVVQIQSHLTHCGRGRHMATMATHLTTRSCTNHQFLSANLCLAMWYR